MLHLSPATRSVNENPEKLGCSILFMTNSLKLEIKVLVQYSTGYLKCFHGHKLERDNYGWCHFYPLPKSKYKRWEMYLCNSCIIKHVCLPISSDNAYLVA